MGVDPAVRKTDTVMDGDSKRTCVCVCERET